jgi:hypothetical protein
MATGAFGDDCNISGKLDWKTPMFLGRILQKMNCIAPSGVTPHRPASMPPQPPLFQKPVHMESEDILQLVQPGPALLVISTYRHQRYRRYIALMTARKEALFVTESNRDSPPARCRPTWCAAIAKLGEQGQQIRDRGLAIAVDISPRAGAKRGQQDQKVGDRHRSICVKVRASRVARSRRAGFAVRGLKLDVVQHEVIACGPAAAATERRPFHFLRRVKCCDVVVHIVVHPVALCSRSVDRQADCRLELERIVVRGHLLVLGRENVQGAAGSTVLA